MLASAWIEDGHVYPRIDLVRKGRFFGEPRVFRDRPQESIALACEVARSIASELEIHRPLRAGLPVTTATSSVSN